VAFCGSVLPTLQRVRVPKNPHFGKHFDGTRAVPMAIVGVGMRFLLFRFFLHGVW
jgi:hypothetical protein